MSGARLCSAPTRHCKSTRCTWCRTPAPQPTSTERIRVVLDQLMGKTDRTIDGEVIKEDGEWLTAFSARSGTCISCGKTSGHCRRHAACSRRAASSKPALWPLIIVPIVLPRIVVLAAAPERIVKTPATPADAEVVTAHDADIGRARAVDDAALRLVVQRNDELGAIIGLAVQRLVRNDERGPRQYGWRDAIEHILWDGDAVKCGLGDVPAVDRDRGPAQAPVGARHGRKHMRADRL